MGPASPQAGAGAALAETGRAGTESNCLTLVPPQEGQATASGPRTNRSKVRWQEEQL